MRNASPSTTPAATTAPISENAGAPSRSANSGVLFPPREPKMFMSVSISRPAAGLTAQRRFRLAKKMGDRCEEIIAPWVNAPFAIVEQSPQRTFDQRRMRPTRRDVADITDGAPTRARRADRRFL